MMWWGDGSWGPGSWVAMVLMMVVAVVAVAALGVWAVRNLGSGRALPAQRPDSSRAEAELAERFGRGEIDEAQFTRARRSLHGGDHPPE